VSENETKIRMYLKKTVDKSEFFCNNILEHLKNRSNIGGVMTSDKNENTYSPAMSANVEYVREKLHDEDTIYNVAEFFKMFGDPTRAKIMSCLEVKDLYVSELAEILDMSVSAVSHQLRVLRNAKLVKGSKSGKEVKYCLDDNHVMQIIECGLTHVNEER